MANAKSRGCFSLLPRTNPCLIVDEFGPRIDRIVEGSTSDLCDLFNFTPRLENNWFPQNPWSAWAGSPSKEAWSCVHEEACAYSSCTITHPKINITNNKFVSEATSLASLFIWSGRHVANVASVTHVLHPDTTKASVLHYLEEHPQAWRSLHINNSRLQDFRTSANGFESIL